MPSSKPHRNQAWRGRQQANRGSSSQLAGDGALGALQPSFLSEGDIADVTSQTGCDQEYKIDVCATGLGNEKDTGVRQTRTKASSRCFCCRGGKPSQARRTRSLISNKQNGRRRRAYLAHRCGLLVCIKRAYRGSGKAENKLRPYAGGTRPYARLFGFGDGGGGGRGRRRVCFTGALVRSRIFSAPGALTCSEWVTNPQV